MVKFKNNNNYKFWHSPLALLVLLIIVLLFGYSIINLIKKADETGEKKRLMLEEIKNLEDKSVFLNAEIARLDTSEGKEETVYSKYPLVKNGEKMVTIVEDDAKKEGNSDSVKKTSFWSRILKVFQ